MGKPLSVDLRRRVVGAIEAGMSTREAAERFSVSKAAAGERARLKRATGDVLPLLHQEFIRFLNQIERDVPAGKSRPRNPGQLLHP